MPDICDLGVSGDILDYIWTCSLIRGAFVPLSKMLNLVIGP